jgi:hypothetical protein
MIKLELSTDDVNILIDLLDTTISEIRTEVMRTDNRDYRKMLQKREDLMKRMHMEMVDKLQEKQVEELA